MKDTNLNLKADLSKETREKLKLKDEISTMKQDK